MGVLNRLVLAAVAFLPLSAFAQSDASFAAALGGLPSGLAVMAQLKTQAQAPEPIELVDEGTWANLLFRAQVYGTFLPASGQDGYSAFEMSAPYEDSAGVKWTANVKVSGVGDKVGFERRKAAISATRSIGTGVGAKLEAYSFITDENGRVRSVLYMSAIRGADGKLVKAPIETLDPSHPLLTAMFVELCRFWGRPLR